MAGFGAGVAPLDFAVLVLASILIALIGDARLQAFDFGFQAADGLKKVCQMIYCR